MGGGARRRRVARCRVRGAVRVGAAVRRPRGAVREHPTGRAPRTRKRGAPWRHHARPVAQPRRNHKTAGRPRRTVRAPCTTTTHAAPTSPRPHRSRSRAPTQREPQQIQPPPRPRIADPLVAAHQPDTPDPVHRARLDEDPFAGAHEEIPERGTGAELVGAALHHQVEARVAPDPFVEAAYQSARHLRLGRGRRVERAAFGLRVAEEPGLAGHHPVLGRRVADSGHGERGRPPLAQAARPELSVAAGRVAPEGQVFHGSARAGVLDQAVA